MIRPLIDIHELVTEAFHGFAESAADRMKSANIPVAAKKAAFKEAARSFGRQMAQNNMSTFVAAKYNLTKDQRAVLLEEQSLQREFEDHTGLADVDRIGQVLGFISDLDTLSINEKAKLAENIFIYSHLIFDAEDHQRYYNMFFNLPYQDLFTRISDFTDEKRDMNTREIESLFDDLLIKPSTLMNEQEIVLDLYGKDQYSSPKDLLSKIFTRYSSLSKTNKRHLAQMVRNLQAMATDYSVKASEHHRQTYTSDDA